VGLTPALPWRSRAGHGEGVAPHRPYAMAGGFGALVGDAALLSATQPTDVPRVDVGQELMFGTLMFGPSMMSGTLMSGTSKSMLPGTPGT